MKQGDELEMALRLGRWNAAIDREALMAHEIYLGLLAKEVDRLRAEHALVPQCSSATSPTAACW